MESPTSHIQLEKDLALKLHVLGCLYGDKIVKSEDKPEDKSTLELKLLYPFYKSQGLLQKFIQVVKAIVTICMANREHNFSVMLGNYAPSGPTSTETHLFFCQNGGPPANDVQKYIHQVWSTLRDIREANLRAVTPMIGHFRKLADVVHSFVIDTMLHRAKKRLPSIEALRETMEPSLLDRFEGKLTHLLLTLAKSAKDSDEACFLDKTRLLWDMTLSPEYEGALQALQAKAQALEIHSFSLKKWIEKLLKIETALLTLYALAVSGRRGGIVMCPLIVHNVPLPSNGSVEVALCDIRESWCPLGQSRATTVERMCAAAGSVTGHTTLGAKVHSECALVAWTAQHREAVAPNITLIPYITSSKRHCLACYIWLQSYNKLTGEFRRLLSYEDSRGGIQPGWWPPPMENKKYTNILKRILSELNYEFHWSMRSYSGVPELTTMFIRPEDGEMMDAKIREYTNTAVLT